jgi:hypothetical protein
MHFDAVLDHQLFNRRPNFSNTVKWKWLSDGLDAMRTIRIRTDHKSVWKLLPCARQLASALPLALTFYSPVFDPPGSAVL